MSLKPPPHSLESEEVVIACCLIDDEGAVYDDVSQIVSASDFYTPRNQIIFSTLGKIVADGKPCSEISLSDYLEKAGELETVGGLEAIFSIQNRVETSSHSKYAARIVKEKSKLRLIQRYAKLAIEGVAESQDADDIIGSLDSHIVSIADTREGEFNLPECVDKALVQLTTVSDELVVPHGMTSFDAEITDGGLKAGQMHTIGARPGRGKTTFALNIAGRTCVAGNGVGIISLEMSDVELIKKLICMKAQVNFEKFKDNLHSQEEQNKVNEATGLIKQWNLQIDDNAYMSADDILTKARIWKRKHDIKLLIIDYLQLIKGCQGDMLREQQVADMSRKIKLMAKSLQIPVIILAQLNRRCEDEDRQPRLTDLRESGAIEQDSDIVTFLYNLNKDKDVDGRSNVLRWVRPKQRNGPAGCFGSFKFNGAMGVISDFH